MRAHHVHFIRGGPSYLPELPAYAAHLQAMGHACTIHADHGTVPADATVLWWICGRVPRAAAAQWPAAFHIHEYASASVPPAAALKDLVKRVAHPRPQHRIFQNEWVRGRMGFTDGVASSLRDMGVPASFLDAQPSGPPEFDLVYLGETTRLARFEAAIRAIHDAQLSLLVVGAMDDALRARLAPLTCTGRVPQADVPRQLLRARAGVNLMPARLPFAQQTSTKALEYLAVGLPVISLDYPWFRGEATRHPGRMRAIDVNDAAQWRHAVANVPPHERDRAHLRSLTWASRLQGLPVWSALP